MYGAHTNPEEGLKKATTSTEMCAQFPCSCMIRLIKKFRPALRSISRVPKRSGLNWIVPKIRFLDTTKPYLSYSVSFIRLCDTHSHQLQWPICRREELLLLETTCLTAAVFVARLTAGLNWGCYVMEKYKWEGNDLIPLRYTHILRVKSNSPIIYLELADSGRHNWSTQDWLYSFSHTAFDVMIPSNSWVLLSPSVCQWSIHARVKWDSGCMGWFRTLWPHH